MLYTDWKLQHSTSLRYCYVFVLIFFVAHHFQNNPNIFHQMLGMCVMFFLFFSLWYGGEFTKAMHKWRNTYSVKNKQNISAFKRSVFWERENYIVCTQIYVSNVLRRTLFTLDMRTVARTSASSQTLGFALFVIWLSKWWFLDKKLKLLYDNFD